MRIKVIYSLWGADGFDEPLTGGVHELEDVTSEQARSIAAAEAAGIVEVVKVDSDAEIDALTGHVQSQEDGEAAYAAAVADGSWEQGNLQQFLAGTYDRIVAAGDDLDPHDRAYLDLGIADAKARLTVAGIDVSELGLPDLPAAPDVVEVSGTDVASVAEVLGDA